jgi:site-specific recombinase XerD
MGQTAIEGIQKNSKRWCTSLMKNSKKKQLSPLPLLDSLEYIGKQVPPSSLSLIQKSDFLMAVSFLKAYVGSLGTFNSYRREIERFLHWTWIISKKSIKDLKREDIENFILFCQKPPKSWIGIKKAPRFVEKEGKRKSNSEWRPFVVTISKAAHRKGVNADIDNFELSQGAIKELFAILSTFYNYMLQEEYVFMNPVALIRQKSKFIRKQQNQKLIRRLSSLQWEYVIETATLMANINGDKYERILFIMTALYSMYLRISELAASIRWIPQMKHFYRDNDGNWWFKTVGKGNKERNIAVSNNMLDALKRYRKHLGLSTLPSAADKTPLLLRTKGKKPITSTTYIREMVQSCFDEAIKKLEEDKHFEEAESLNEATVHWLRHTGISEDVKHRPREHVRDDAGHSSSATTDLYIDVELRERHRSAKNKPILSDS